MGMLKKSPSQTELNNLIQIVNSGNYAAAETIATPLSKAYPKAILIWKILGVAIAEQGRMAEAIAPMQKVIQLEPKDAEAHRNLATALKELGQIKSAEAHFRKSITLNSQDALANMSLGKILNEQLNFVDAEKLCRKAIMLSYDFPEAHDQLGIALLGQKKLADAESSFRAAILLKPDMADAHNNLGITLNEQIRYSEAESSYIQALKLNAIFTNAFMNLAKNFSDQEKYTQAEIAYRKALEIDPKHTLSLTGLGLALHLQRKEEEARAILEQALALDAQLPEALNTLGNVHKELGNTQIALDYYRKAIAIKPEFTFVYSNLLLIAGYHAKLPPEQLLQEAKQFGAYVSAQVKKPYTHWLCQLPNGSNKLRIGFVSGDLKRHAVAFFLEGLLRHFDKNKIELIAYTTQPKEDEVTALIKPHFIKWQPIYGKSDKDAAEIIYQDAPHILFDLSGHTAYNRLPMFAYKPAPIQVTWAGYPATTGMDEMDYILADPYLVPVGEDHPFVEQVWCLPEVAGCFAPLVEDVPVARLPALQNGYVTFGCFNNLVKMSDDVVAVWSQILNAIPDSKLYLQTRQLSEQSVVQQTYERYAAHGIAPERLILEGVTPRVDYFKSYNKIDIALDPFPCPGGTTTADTLWMSVPVLTMKGRDFWSRLGESLAHNVGLPNWIANDSTDYVSKAVAFAEDKNYLVKLRSELRDKVMASPLFDAERFTKHFEEAMREMINAHQSKFKL
jgi:protein O-GlcNAc transferase